MSDSTSVMITDDVESARKAKPRRSQSPSFNCRVGFVDVARAGAGENRLELFEAGCETRGDF